jgi:hypothetical protein
MLLKDGIMFLHHGIELMMKQVLVQKSPYLIFENLHDASEKQKVADGKGVSIFMLDKPPRTVTYEESINRVEAFVKPPLLTPRLRERLQSLNELRNQVEHYEITVDRDEVVKILAEIREPLLNLFEGEMPGTKKKLELVKVNRIWNGIENAAKDAMQFENEVYDVVCFFKGQKIPGRLLSAHDPFTLPIFERGKVKRNYRAPDSRVELDIFAEDATGKKWAIETKLTARERHVEIISRVKLYVASAHADVAWVVFSEELSEWSRSLARREEILISGRKELQELKKIVGFEERNSRKQN